MHQDLVKKINYIPTLPTVLTLILSLLNDPQSSAGDLEHIITNDQSLSSKVLAVANSSYYGFRHEILTVRRAVVALGYEEIRNICLGASLVGYLHPSTFPDRKAAEALWLHSICTGEAARLLAKNSGTYQPDPAFSAGLLHDLGKVVLTAYFPKQQQSVKSLMDGEGLSFRQAEMAADADHCELGLALSNIWDLPPQLGQAIGYHHEPTPNLDYYDLAGLIHLANFMARQLGLGDSGNPDPPHVDLKVLDGLGISQKQFMSTRRDLHTRQKAITGLWEMLVNISTD